MNNELLRRMEVLLKGEYPTFLTTLDESVHRGLRVNTLKCTSDDLQQQLSFSLKPTVISNTVFEISTEIHHLGNLIEHHQGLYSLQEVSATSAVKVLQSQPKEWILDLCAALGGKTTQIAMKMKNEGLLFMNEIDPQRAQILLSNCERCGGSNAIITCNSPEQLVSSYQGQMDRILVDAPCSGEGMFKSHSQANVEACAARQKRILESAYLMLKEGEILVYSTCTYAIEENEAVLDSFLKRHPDMELVPCSVQFGHPRFDYENISGNLVRRIFPMD